MPIRFSWCEKRAYEPRFAQIISWFLCFNWRKAIKCFRIWGVLHHFVHNEKYRDGKNHPDISGARNGTSNHSTSLRLGDRFKWDHFLTAEKTDRLKPIGLFWCEKRDLNPYGVNHTPLKRARLPVPPLSHIFFSCFANTRCSLRQQWYYTTKLSFCQALFEKNLIFFKKGEKRLCKGKPSRRFLIFCHQSTRECHRGSLYPI